MTTLTYHQHGPISGLKNWLNRAGHGVAAFLANISVALAWADGRRAYPSDLAKAGFSRDFENRVLATMNTTLNGR